MNGFREENKTLVLERDHETILIQPWGKDSLRVRSTMSPQEEGQGKFGMMDYNK